MMRKADNLRQKHLRGQPIHPTIKALILELLLETGNLKRSKHLLREHCGLEISYPTLIKFANEIGLQRHRGRPKGESLA